MHLDLDQMQAKCPFGPILAYTKCENLVQSVRWIGKKGRENGEERKANFSPFNTHSVAMSLKRTEWDRALA